MLELMAMYLDNDGLPRAYAVGLVESNKDLDNVKSLAADMLDKYIKSKPYALDPNDYTLSIEIVD